jgi:[acyl-carrier-protein] S-malonyltransferase
MKPAQDQLERDLKNVIFDKSRVPVICNVDAASHFDAATSRDALVRQVTGSVKWYQSMQLLISSGVQTFVEVGPGKVLCGLMRQIDRAKNAVNVSDEASLQKALKSLEVLSA